MITAKEQKIVNMTYDLIDSNLGESILDEIVNKAYEIFEKCGTIEDFCIQTKRLSTIVFGGSDRIRWTIDGFEPIRTHCSTKFMIKWHEMK